MENDETGRRGRCESTAGMLPAAGTNTGSPGHHGRMEVNDGGTCLQGQPLPRRDTSGRLALPAAFVDLSEANAAQQPLADVGCVCGGAPHGVRIVA